MTFVLGLTGGIATGKSTAAAFFSQKGLPVIDADAVAHKLMQPGQTGWQAIKDNFGPQFLKADGGIDRQKLGKFVFAHASQLEKLDRLLHPLINHELAAQVKSYCQQKMPLLVLDIPLLFETGDQKLCDAVLVISVPRQVELQRLEQRNHLSEKEAQARIQSQMPLPEKEARANYVIDNTGTIGELEEKLAKILKEIKAGV